MRSSATDSTLMLLPFAFESEDAEPLAEVEAELDADFAAFFSALFSFPVLIGACFQGEDKTKRG